MNTKRCSRCEQTKPVSAFSPDRSAKSGYRSHCRQCRSEQYLESHGEKLPYTKSKQIEWGYGRARLAPDLGLSEEVVVTISDVHVPYQDDQAVAAALALIRAVQPHTVIVNGDVPDLFEISTHCKDPERWDQLGNDLIQTNAFLGSVREASGDARIFATEGNHENRLRSYIKLNAPKLQSLPGMQLESLIHYAENGITFVPGEQGFLLRPDYLVMHGNLIRGETGASAKAYIQKHGISGQSGHTHRLGEYVKTGYVQREWIETGGLMRTDADYVEAPNWQQGMVVTVFSKSGAFIHHKVPFVDGQMHLGLTTY